MHGTLCCFGLFNRINQDLMFKKSACTDIFGDASKVLIEHTTCAQIHMTHFGVAHLTIWQTDIFTRTRNQSMRMLLLHSRQVWSLCSKESIIFDRLTVSDTIHNYQYVRNFASNCIRHDLHSLSINWSHYLTEFSLKTPCIRHG